jgi:predicted O-methyltransferase YrrM
MQSAAVVEPALPPQAVMFQMISGAWVTKVVSEATRLGIPDLVKQHGPLRALELVTTYGIIAVPDALERLLRACASVGVFTEDAAGKFGPTELSEVLTSDSPVSLKKLVEAIGGSWYKGWTELFEAVRTGKPQARKVFGAEWWDYLNANPKELEDFGAAMQSASQNSLRGLLENCDFTGIETIADIGGGFGHLAIALLQKYPRLRATVMDVPDVVRIAPGRVPLNDATVADRLEYVGGDMFDSVPPAEVYVLKLIIHDWEDEKCIRLLANCRRSMRGNGRVICIDSVLPPMGNTSATSAKFRDLLMLVLITGRERTEAQWQQLYGAAGFEIRSITPMYDNHGMSMVEGIKH